VAPGWYWVFGSGRSLKALSRGTARVVRFMAEGEKIPSPRETSPWMVLLYIMAGFISLLIVGRLIDIIASMVD
jgi:hypothetical protein